ncbi:unnamed protein product [Ectocarpus sp. 12 AP-2014]
MHTITCSIRFDSVCDHIVLLSCHVTTTTRENKVRLHFLSRSPRSNETRHETFHPQYNSTRTVSLQPRQRLLGSSFPIQKSTKSPAQVRVLFSCLPDAYVSRITTRAAYVRNTRVPNTGWTNVLARCRALQHRVPCLHEAPDEVSTTHSAYSVEIQTHTTITSQGVPSTPRRILTAEEGYKQRAFSTNENRMYQSQRRVSTTMKHIFPL